MPFFAWLTPSVADDDPLAPFYAEAADADAETLRIDLAADYNQLFLGMSAHPVAPYESVYTSDEGLMMQEARDNVLRAYQQWGLRVPDSFDLPEDHIALELEFMACLADRAREALGASSGEHEPDDSAQKAEALPTSSLRPSARSWTSHLSWVPAFCRDVEKRARTAFYYGIASLTRQQLEADGAMLKEL